jgi:hypothetical protein
VRACGKRPSVFQPEADGVGRVLASPQGWCVLGSFGKAVGRPGRAGARSAVHGLPMGTGAVNTLSMPEQAKRTKTVPLVGPLIWICTVLRAGQDLPRQAGEQRDPQPSFREDCGLVEAFSMRSVPSLRPWLLFPRATRLQTLCFGPLGRPPGHGSPLPFWHPSGRWPTAGAGIPRMLVLA